MGEMKFIVAWAADRLSMILGFDAPELAQIAASLPVDQISSHFFSLLGESQSSNDFVEELCRRRTQLARTEGITIRTGSSASSDDSALQPSNEIRTVHAERIATGAPSSNRGARSTRFTARGTDQLLSMVKSCTSLESLGSDASSLERCTMKCNCYATLHAIFTNCVNCGRVTCIVEAAARCPECDCPLLTVESMQFVTSNDIREARMNAEADQKAANEMLLVTGTTKKPKPNVTSSSNVGETSAVLDSRVKAAIQHRNMLVAYDRDKKGNTTRLIDDHGDNFDDKTGWAESNSRVKK